YTAAKVSDLKSLNRDKVHGSKKKRDVSAPKTVQDNIAAARVGADRKASRRTGAKEMFVLNTSSFVRLVIIDIHQRRDRSTHGAVFRANSSCRIGAGVHDDRVASDV